MDILRAVQGYMSKMMDQTSGVKVLLLDSETTPVISQASTTSNLLSHVIYLTDRIDNFAGRERMPHLSCLAFLRPSKESIAALERELREPRYGSYWLFFCNVLSKSALERLAEADEHEVVREVQEYFADYCPITSSHYSLNVLPSPLSADKPALQHRLYGDTPNTWDMNPQTGSLQRHVEGLMALLLSLKKKPFIRYDRNSQLARKLGQELIYQYTTEQQLFSFRPSNVPPLLLILDRRSDPMTPLLTQWTYQAMVHDLVGIHNGRVSLADAPDVSKENKEVVLSTEQDQFFANTLYDNFGDLGAHIKEYVAQYQTKGGNQRRLDTVADMKRFIDDYPEYRRLGGNVSKHVAIMSELSRLVEKEKLFDVSELEQYLASSDRGHGNDLRNVMEVLSPGNGINRESKLRVAMLYALRYQNNQNNDIRGIIKLLVQSAIVDGYDESVAAADGEMVRIMLNYAKDASQLVDTSPLGGIFSRGKTALKGLKGVDNVYTQHTPKLEDVLEQTLAGKLRESSYPFVEGQEGLQDYLRHQAATSSSTMASNTSSGVSAARIEGYRPQDVIVFIVGGTTYEEARTVAMLNSKLQQQQQGHNQRRVILGGTGILNSKDFVNLVRDAATRFPSTASSTLAAGLRSLSSVSSSSNAPPVPSKQGFLGDNNTGNNNNLGFQIGNLIPGQSGGPSRTANTIEAGVDGFVDAAKNFIGKVKRGVEDL